MASTLRSGISLRTKLILIILFVGLTPPSVSAWVTLSIHRDALVGNIRALHSSLAQQGATSVSDTLDAARQRLGAALESIHWDRLSPAELEGALTLVYRQLDETVVTSLFDEAGNGIGPSVYWDGAPTTESEHPPASLQTLEAYAGAIPFVAAQRDGFALGDPFVRSAAAVGQDAGAAVPLLPVAFRVRGKDGVPWVVAGAVSLASMCAEVTGTPRGDLRTRVLDARGRQVCAADGPPLAPVEADLRESLAGETAPVTRSLREGMDEILLAFAPADYDWSVVVEQPARSAFAPSRRILNQTLFWIGVSLVIAVIAGLLLAQGINRPVTALVHGALEYAKGNFSFRLDAAGHDEFARLSATFNEMGAEIEKRDSELQAWNEELQKRVDQRTSELKEAQDQLLQSQKIAAVSSLGAGIAHEINNPLTGVLGLSQMVKLRLTRHKECDHSAEVELIERAEGESRRIKNIVATLLSFSESYAGEGFIDVDVNATLEEAVDLLTGQISGGGIEVVRDLAARLPTVLGNRSELSQAFLHLLTNACKAMPDGGTLTLTSSSLEGQVVRVAIADDGFGIGPDDLPKIFEPFYTAPDGWRGKGLGLTQAYNIVQEHHGRIKVDSVVGKGTTVTITLPAAKSGAHLI